MATAEEVTFEPMHERVHVCLHVTIHRCHQQCRVGRHEVPLPHQRDVTLIDPSVVVEARDIPGRGLERVCLTKSAVHVAQGVDPW